MNSSAKITVSFLAAAALGAAVIFTGCTVGSGTVSDTDGGTPNNDSGTTPTDGGGTTDTGPGTATCQKKTGVRFSNVPACEACLDNSCCTAQQECFNIPSEGDAGTLDCNGYVDCVDDCTTTKTGSELEACYGECDTLAGAGVQTAYDKIVTCAETNCNTPCAGETPDGG